jgi:hypothetical protein
MPVRIHNSEAGIEVVLAQKVRFETAFLDTMYNAADPKNKGVSAYKRHWANQARRCLELAESLQHYGYAAMDLTRPALWVALGDPNDEDVDFLFVGIHTLLDLKQQQKYCRAVLNAQIHAEAPKSELERQTLLQGIMPIIFAIKDWHMTKAVALRDRMCSTTTVYTGLGLFNIIKAFLNAYGWSKATEEDLKILNGLFAAEPPRKLGRREYLQMGDALIESMDDVLRKQEVSKLTPCECAPRKCGLGRREDAHRL